MSESESISRRFPAGESTVSPERLTNPLKVECVTRFISHFTLALCGRSDFRAVLAQLSDLLGGDGAVLARADTKAGTLREIERSNAKEVSRWYAMPEKLSGMTRGSVQFVATPSGDAATLMMILRQEKDQADLLFVRFADAPSIEVERFVSALAATAAEAWRHRNAGLIAGKLASKPATHRRDASLASRQTLLGEDNAFGLSRSEFRVCNLIRAGLKPRQISDELGVSIATVRTHLRGIYAKTGLSGQFEVLHKLGTDAAFHLQSERFDPATPPQPYERQAG